MASTSELNTQLRNDGPRFTPTSIQYTYVLRFLAGGIEFIQADSLRILSCRVGWRLNAHLKQGAINRVEHEVLLDQAKEQIRRVTERVKDDNGARTKSTFRPQYVVDPLKYIEQLTGAQIELTPPSTTPHHLSPNYRRAWNAKRKAEMTPQQIEAKRLRQREANARYNERLKRTRCRVNSVAV